MIFYGGKPAGAYRMRPYAAGGDACIDPEGFRCRLCGKLTSNRIAADDNPMLLMSIAMRPLCTLPFPLERIEEMAALMGGEGRMR